MTNRNQNERRPKELKWKTTKKNKMEDDQVYLILWGVPGLVVHLLSP